MALKQIPIRFDEELAEQLRLRSTVEHRSMNDIVVQAVREYTTKHPISREKMLELVRAIAREDKALLKALADA